MLHVVGLPLGGSAPAPRLIARFPAAGAGGDALLALRGGAYAELQPSVITSLVANTLAILIYNLISSGVAILRLRAQRASGRRQTTTSFLLVQVVVSVLGGSFAYLLAYYISGHVPMGLVQGSRPLLPAFAPR